MFLKGNKYKFSFLTASRIVFSEPLGNSKMEWTGTLAIPFLFYFFETGCHFVALSGLEVISVDQAGTEFSCLIVLAYNATLIPQICCKNPSNKNLKLFPFTLGEKQSAQAYFSEVSEDKLSTWPPAKMMFILLKVLTTRCR